MTRFGPAKHTAVQSACGVPAALLVPLFAVILGLAPSAMGGQDPDAQLAALREGDDDVEHQLEELAGSEPAQGEGAQAEPDEAISVGEFLERLESADHTSQYGSLESLLSIHGFLDFAYTAPEGGTSTFDLAHANMFFAADLGELAQAWIEVEYEHAGEVIEVDQAELRLTFDDTTLGLGYFYAPFGIERRSWYPPRKYTISRPDAFRHVVPGNWYETGIRVNHRRTLFDVDVEAELAITNGLGPEADTDIREARQSRDNNNEKAVIGRMGVLSPEGVSCGLSFATMAYEADDTICFVGADVEYSPDGWLFRAEAVVSSVEDPDGPVGDFRREGGYLLAARELVHDDQRQLWVSGRLDVLDGNTGVTDGEDYTAYTLGATWWHTANLSFRIEARGLEARHGATLAGDTVFAASAVMDF